MSEIAKWFSNKNVFVTGATGYIGKCLVIKLLRDCPDIGNVYMIMRPKKGVNFEQRKLDYLNHVTFSRLKEINPSAIDKIKIVEGDICEQNLGMSDANRKLIAETVSIIFHSAADVRFDRRLIDAYKTNVYGSIQMLDFASEFKNINAFVLVSTAFSQTLDIGKLEERHYESCVTPEYMQKLIDNVDEDVLDILTPKIIGKHPNTYGFTKSLVEQLVYNYSNKFPTAVARPPIVVSSWKEPLVGYTEGIHGINGWSLASGRGILRSMLCEDKDPCNVMPSDVVVNGIIVLAHECGKRHELRLKELKADHGKELDSTTPQTTELYEKPIYFNITEEHPISWWLYVDCILPNYLKCPFDLAIWHPGGGFKTNRPYHYLCVFLYQIIPALLVDLLLPLFRYQPFMLKVQRIIVASCQSLEYYMNNKFVFKADAYNAASGRLNKIDKEIFYNRTKMVLDEYLLDAAYGTRFYLAKEKPENIPKARRFFRNLWYLDIFTKTMFIYWVAKKILTYLNVSIY